MAITARAEGTWAVLTADGAVTIPGSPVDGDMMYLLVAWKPFGTTAQVTSPAGWTEITEFADGAVANGNGVGSVKVAAYKKEFRAGDGNPTIDYSASPDVSGAVIIVFQKGASETWDDVRFVTAAMTNWTTSSQTVTASTTPRIRTGDLIVGLIGIRDDSATMTRPTTGVAAGAITFTGNYVEYPSGHLTTTTGFDMSADAGYRITSSSGSAAPTMTGTISAAETGAALWLLVGVTTPGFGQAQAAIKAFDVEAFGQAQADIKQTYRGYGQAQARMAGATSVFAQAQADIKQTYPLSPYERVIKSDSPIAYFRLGEPSGTIMYDETGAHSGAYVGSPALNEPGGLTGDSNTAVTFDGSDDSMWGIVSDWDTVPDKPVSLECWVQWDQVTWPTDTHLGGWVHQVGVMSLQFYVDGDGSTFIGLRIGTEQGNANANATAGFLAGDWLHIVGTIDSGGNARLYFDGVLVAGPNAVTFSGGASDSPFKIGNSDEDGVNASWPGTIDEFAVYDYALTPAQIVAHYNAGALSAVGSFGQAQARIKQTYPLSPYARTVITDGPSAYWRLGEYKGTVASEEISGKNGAYQDAPTLGITGALSSETDTAVTFNGTSEYISVSDDAALDLGDGPFSLEVWFKRGNPADTDEQMLISKGQDAYALTFNVSGDHKLAFAKDNVSVIVRQTGTITDTNWHHVIVTKNGATSAIYVDGVDQTGSVTNATLVDTAVSLFIGAEQAGGPFLYWDGSLDEVSIYKYVLTPEQILNHYTVGSPYSGTIIGDSPVGYWRLGESTGTTANNLGSEGTDGTYTGGYTLSQPGAILDDTDTSVDFNGTTGYVAISTTPSDSLYSLVHAGGIGELSVEAWAYCDTQTDFNYIITKVGATTYEWGLARFAGGGVRFTLWDGGGAQVAEVDYLTALPTGWYHFVATMKMLGGTDGVLILYIDSVEVGRDDTWSPTFTPSDTDASISIGRRAGAGEAGSYWPHRIDEVAIYDYVLTSDQIVEHFNVALDLHVRPEPFGQAQAEITAGAGATNVYAQAQAWIKVTGIEGCGQAQAQIKQTYRGYGQAQADIKQTYRGYGQSQAQIKQTYRGYAQAQAQIKQTYRAYAQAQADIKQTYNAYGQAQADIKATYQAYGQAQAWIEQTYNAFAQAQAYILVTAIEGFGQAQADIKATYNAYAQAQADIKQTYNAYAQAQATLATTNRGYGQAQAWIEQTYNAFAQAQADIKQTYRSYAQAQAQIKQVYNAYAQAQAKIATTRVYGQAQAQIKQTYIACAQAQAKIATTRAYGQAQAQIKQTYRGYGQAQADIKQTYNSYAQAQAQIKQVYRSYAQAQAWIETTYNAFAQAQAWIEQTYNQYAQAQAWIEQTYNAYAQAQAEIKQTYNAFAQANAWIEQTYVGCGQAQACIKGNAFGQAQADIKATYNQFAQAQAQIKQTYFGFAQANSNIEATINSCGQAQGQIKQTYQAYAQAQAQIKQVYNAYGQAQADIKQVYNAYGQAQADIKQVYNAFAQAQAWIEQIYQQYGQAQADIKATYQAYGQAQADIKATYNAYAQAQGYIKVTDVEACGQAQAQIKQTYQAYAQAQARLIAFGVKAFGQANASISFTGNAAYAQAQAKIRSFGYPRHGQAQADIKATYRGYAQAQADIEQTYNRYAQAQADILQTYNGYGQSQADIKQTYQAYGQAQALIVVTNIEGCGQAQGTIKQVYNAYAQAQATIKATSNGYGQANCAILGAKLVYAQAQGTIKAAGRSYGQAQADIKATSNGYGQAQGDIKQTYNGYGQANCYIKVADIEACAQAQASIKSTYQNCAQAQANIKAVSIVCSQAQADIKTTYQVYAQAQAYILILRQGYGQAQATIEVTTNQYGQANADILATTTRCGQAQALIVTKNLTYAQAQANIKVITNGYGQAVGLITSGTAGYGQAQAHILRTENGSGQAQATIVKAAGYGQAAGYIFRTHTLANVEVSDDSGITVTLSDDSIDSDLDDESEDILSTIDDDGITVTLDDEQAITVTLSDDAYI